MTNRVNEIKSSLLMLQNNARRLVDVVGSLKHEDFAVNSFIKNLKKISLQELDLLSLFDRQLSFLGNEIRSFEMRNKQKQQLLKQMGRRSK